ncbi:MAG: hypothetical protein JNG88_06720 [Phycisphaerales bacterium]|nr:hypothetical protein [Phycisphaerales bacterium]
MTRSTRHNTLFAAVVVAAMWPMLAGGCGAAPTDTELRTILANGATTTSVTTINTAFTSTVGEIFRNVLSKAFKSVFGVPAT